MGMQVAWRPMDELPSFGNAMAWSSRFGIIAIITRIAAFHGRAQVQAPGNAATLSSAQTTERSWWCEWREAFLRSLCHFHGDKNLSFDLALFRACVWKVVFQTVPYP